MTDLSATMSDMTTTVDPATAPIIVHSEPLPDWFRVPRPGPEHAEQVESVFGLAQIWPAGVYPDSLYVRPGEPSKAGQPRWQYYVHSRGGGSGGWADSVEQAIEKITATRAFSTKFWDEKVGLSKKGVKGATVIRCDGIHYIAYDGANHPRRGGTGYDGALFRFRMIEDGRLVESNNVWYQGQVPPEYRDLLPDNAVRDTDA